MSMRSCYHHASTGTATSTRWRGRPLPGKLASAAEGLQVADNGPSPTSAFDPFGSYGRE